MHTSNKLRCKYVLLLIFQAIISTHCTVTKQISDNEIPMPGYTAYMVHTPDTSILLSSIEKSGEFLTGILYSGSTRPNRNKTVDIFVAPDSAIIRNGNQVLIPARNIAKLEAKKTDGAKTFLYTFFTCLIGIPLIGFLGIIIGGGWGA